MRRFCTLNRFTPLAGESTRYFHSTAFEKIDFSVSSSRFTVPGLTRFGGSFLLERTPGPVQPIAFELLDAMRRDFVEDRRTEEPVQRLQNLAITLSTSLVQIRVIPQIDLGDCLKVMSGVRRMP
jgi:hypothetical protein